MKFRLLVRGHGPHEWRPLAVVYENQSVVTGFFPYRCRFRRQETDARSLEEASPECLLPGYGSAHLTHVCEAPDPPKHHWWESMAGLLRGRLVYLCERCDATGVPIFYGLEWAEMLEPGEVEHVLIRGDSEHPLDEPDFHCPKCTHEWNSLEAVDRNYGVEWSEHCRVDRLADGRLYFRLQIDGTLQAGHLDRRGRMSLLAANGPASILPPSGLRAARIQELLRQRGILPPLEKLHRTGP